MKTQEARIPCPECEETCELSCAACGGLGGERFICRQCNGRGLVPCHACDGAGDVWVDAGHLDESQADLVLEVKTLTLGPDGRAVDRFPNAAPKPSAS